MSAGGSHAPLVGEPAPVEVEPRDALVDDARRRALPGHVPGDVDALVALVRAAHDERRALLPVGLDTRGPLGALPARADALVSTRALDAVVLHEPGDLTITVQAGMPLTALAERLRPHRQRLAAAPFAPHGSVGGLVMSGAEGALALRHGTIRDALLGARTVHGDGVLARSKGRVVKNVAGYDVPRLLTGSLGSLGVLVEASLRLVPIPARSALCVATYADATRAFAAARAVLDAPLEPGCVDVLGGAAPDDPRPRLLVLLEGGAARVDGQLERLDALLDAQRPDARTWLRDDDALPFLARLDDVPRALLADAAWDVPPSAADGPPAPAPRDALALRLVRTPRTLPEALAALLADARAVRLEARWLARPGLGSATLALRPAAHVAASHEAFARTAAALLDPPARAPGLRLLRAPDALRADPARVFGPPPPALPLMRDVKRALDPRGVLAPGVQAGGL